jgi:hypothetical protein
MILARRPRRAAVSLAALWTLAFTGCSEPTRPVVSYTPVPFALAASGSLSMDFRGFTAVLPVQRGGYHERSAAGELRSDIAPLILTANEDTDAGDPSLSLGILGSIDLGTYRVRVAGSGHSPVPEFIATLIAPATDGSSTHYELTSGSLTVTSLRPLRGFVRGYASRAHLWPAASGVGSTVFSVPAAVFVSGQFGAP